MFTSKNKVGKFNPIYDEEETMTIECDTIVTAYWTMY